MAQVLYLKDTKERYMSDTGRDLETIKEFHRVLRRSLRPPVYSVFCAIEDHAGTTPPDGLPPFTCFASDKTLADEASVSRATVMRSVEELAELKLIQVQEREGYTSLIWPLVTNQGYTTFMQEQTARDQLQKDTCITKRQGVLHKATGGVAQSDTNETKIKKPNNELNPTTSVVGEPPPPLENNFEVVALYQPGPEPQPAQEQLPDVLFPTSRATSTTYPAFPESSPLTGDRAGVAGGAGDGFWDTAHGIAAGEIMSILPNFLGLTDTQIANFQNKIEKTADGCWLWTGALTNLGYGKFGVNGNTLLSHRVAFLTFKGEIPDELPLDHFHCQNRQCVNPDHLEPVTQKENILRGQSFSAVNALKTHCPQNHPYDEENTRYSTIKNGVVTRHCKACEKANAKSKTKSNSKARDERLDNPAVILYRENCKLTPNEVQRDMIITQVTDLGEWEKNLKYWMGAGYKPGSLDKILDCYKNQNYKKGEMYGSGGNGKQGFGTNRPGATQIGQGSYGRVLGKSSAFGRDGRLTDEQLEKAW